MAAARARTLSGRSTARQENDVKFLIATLMLVATIAGARATTASAAPTKRRRIVE
jgi:hypothetical protein